MSKTELLEEFAKLPPAERTEIFEALCEMEQLGLVPPTPEEMALLDAELEAYTRDGNPGESWEKVEARLRKQV